VVRVVDERRTDQSIRLNLRIKTGGIIDLHV
jgi:hypothetical protein